MKNVGILGYGEVGRSIAKFYTQPKIKDLNRNDNLTGVEVFHVCIPYTAKFIDTVKKEIKEINPGLTIIHSTVPVGTTKKIGGMIVHSPVRGCHPNLYKSLKIFLKFIGYDSLAAGKLAKKHFQKLGIKSKLVFDSRNTEALKLWSTAQYGFFIILNKEIKKFCEKNRLDFDIIYTLANQSYNEGYLKLNRPEVVRPWLKYIPGKIGGHCLVPNCRLLKSKILNFILHENSKQKILR